MVPMARGIARNSMSAAQGTHDLGLKWQHRKARFIKRRRWHDRGDAGHGRVRHCRHVGTAYDLNCDADLAVGNINIATGTAGSITSGIMTVTGAARR